jgi:CubicO group peptidase (beta-lactamase class C family)
MNNRSFIKLLGFAFLAITISCKKEPSKPPDLSPSLDNIFSTAGSNTNLRCLIVYKTDHIVKEKYYHRGDSSAPHDVRSVTKSVMATLIGIAIDKGIILSENQKIGDYLRHYVSPIDSTKANIKIRDVLSMSSGLEGDELTDPLEYNIWITSPDQISYTLNKPMIKTPGYYFNYNNGTAHLTSAILTQAAGISTIQFASQNLFNPLGIDTPLWETDKRGINNGAAGLSLTPSDMVKIGKLYMNNGVFNGTRIVSEEWISKATSFKISTHNIEPFGPDYGYLWWIGYIENHKCYFANGYGGQFIVVVPDMELLVVATNNWSGVEISTANQQWYRTLSLIMETIIPYFIDSE